MLIWLGGNLKQFRLPGVFKHHAKFSHFFLQYSDGNFRIIPPSYMQEDTHIECRLEVIELYFRDVIPVCGCTSILFSFNIPNMCFKIL